MTNQKLYSFLRQAIDEYNMIEDGDKIAIGVSGGKDSLTLLCGLAGLRRFYPKKFDLVAITVDLGYDANEHTRVKRLCESLGVDYYVVYTKINEMVKAGECSLCSRLRKGALTNKALELGCSRIAYAHNQDDVVETMLMSLIYEGRFSAFWPVTHFREKNISVIRPMILTPVADVIGYANKYKLEIEKSSCPYDKSTKRTYVRGLLKDINKEAPGVKNRMFTALKNDGKLQGEVSQDGE